MGVSDQFSSFTRPSQLSPVIVAGCFSFAHRVGTPKAPPVLSATFQSSYVGSSASSSTTTRSSSPSPLTSASVHLPKL